MPQRRTGVRIDWRQIRVPMLMVLCAVTAALIGLVAWRTQEIRQANRAVIAAQAAARADTLAAQLRDTIEATLRHADAAHDVARLLSLARFAGDGAGERSLRPLLDPALGRGGPDVGQAGAIDAKGHLIWTNINWNAAPTDLSDREHFTAFLADPALPAFFSRPLLGRVSGEWTVQYARSVRGVVGNLLAVTVLSLRSTMIARLCNDITLAPDDDITLLRDDGVVLMRRDMAHHGESIPAMLTPPANLAGVPQPSVGPFDGVARFHALRRVSGTNLFVRVGISRQSQEATAAPYAVSLRSWSLLLELAIGGIALAIAGTILVLGSASEAAARAQSLADSEAWFHHLIEDMGEGVVIFDIADPARVSIAYANRAAATIMGTVPQEMIGRAAASFLDPDESPAMEQRRVGHLDGAKLPPQTYRATRPDGQQIRLAASTVLSAMPSDPARKYFVTVLRDVTGQYEREADLRTARERIERILHVIPGAFYQTTLSPDGALHLNFLSESVTRVFGVPYEEASRRGFLIEAVPPEDMARRSARIAQTRSGEVISIDYPVHVNGRVVHVRDTIRPIDHPGGARELVGFIADAAAEQAAERARQRLHWALRAYSGALGFLVRAIPLTEQARLICESIVEQPGYGLAMVGLPEDSEGKPVRYIAFAGPAKGYMADLRTSWSTDRPEGRGPVGITVRSGEPFVVDDTHADERFAPWRENALRFGIRATLTVPCKVDGKVVAVVSIYAAQPSTFGAEEVELFQRLADEIGFAVALERERAAARIVAAAREAAEQRLHTAAQLGPGLLYLGALRDASLQVEQVFGDLSRIGQVVTRAELPDLAQLLAAPEPMEAIAAAADDETITQDFAIPAPDGQTLWLRNTARVAIRPDGARDVIGYLVEITREKQESLHRQQETTLLTLGEMATGIAHELNQPLTSISFAAQNAAVQLRRTPPDTAAVAAKIDRINLQALRAAKLIAHMRMLVAGTSAEPEPIAWRDVLEAALEVLAAKLRGCELKLDLPADLPDVLGESVPMQQIVINLIGNAVDAYQIGERPLPHVIIVSARRCGDQVALSVADKAGGIPPQIIGRVFEPFFSTKLPGKGTGLGLSLVHRAVTHLHGTITVANADGGAVFQVSLPIEHHPT